MRQVEAVMARCDYANARAGARRSRLLGERGLRDLLARPGTSERLAALAQGPWRRALPASGGALGAVIDGLTADVGREELEVLSFLDGKPLRLVAAVLRLEDALVVEAVIRGLMRREPRQRILAATWPSPGVPARLVAELAALPGPERAPEVLARRGHPLAGVVAAALVAAAEEPRLLRFGAALQRHTAEAVAAEIAGHGEDAAIAREALAWHVDGANATTLLALERVARPAELFIPGGRHALAELLAVAGMPLVRRRARVAAWFGALDRAGALDPELLQDPAMAAQFIARARERALLREARARPLSIAVPLALVAAHAAEARRLKVVLLGGEHGLPPEQLLDLVEA